MLDVSSPALSVKLTSRFQLAEACSEQHLYATGQPVIGFVFLAGTVHATGTPNALQIVLIT